MECTFGVSKTTVFGHTTAYCDTKAEEDFFVMVIKICFGVLVGVVALCVIARSGHQYRLCVYRCQHACDADTEDEVRLSNTTAVPVNPAGSEQDHLLAYATPVTTWQ
jgi:hypothetical protein